MQYGPNRLLVLLSSVFLFGGSLGCQSSADPAAGSNAASSKRSDAGSGGGEDGRAAGNESDAYAEDSNDAGDGGGSSPEPNADTGGDGGVPGLAADAVDCGGVTPDATVSIRNRSFTPETTAISPGGVVRFENREDDEHDVTSGVPGNSDVGALFGSNLLQRGDAFCVKFERVGDYPYFCSLHPSDMRGVVQVENGGGGNGGDPREVSCASGTAETIEIRDRRYVDGDRSIQAGEAVEWVNRDDEEHTVTSGTGEEDPNFGALFDSGPFENGESFCLEFPSTGSFPYFGLERGADEMSGTITVQ